MKMKKTFAAAAIVISICIAAFAATETVKPNPKPAQKTSAQPASAQPAPVPAPAAAPAAATSTVPVPPASQPAALPSAQQIFDASAAFYKVVNFYSVTFELYQAQGVGGQGSKMGSDEESREKFRNEYHLIYLDEKPGDEDYLMRLTSVRGYQQHTTVVFAPDKKGEYKYTVYKPAGRVVLPPSDLRITDVPKTLISSVIEELQKSLEDRTAIFAVVYLPAVDEYSVEVAGETGRVTTYFNAKTFQLAKQDIELKIKKNYQLKRSVVWRDFVANPQIGAAQITAKPEKL